MPCTLEHLTAPEIFLLRQGPKHFAHGDDWLISAVVEKFGSYAVIKGACNTCEDRTQLLDIPSIREQFRKLGITAANWERSKDGVFIPHSMVV
ncbi:MAG: hypothetical protein AB7E55_01050 [Pigmentiphaga sp.]